MEWHRLGRFGRGLGGRCRWHDPGIAVKLVHAATIFSDIKSQPNDISSPLHAPPRYAQKSRLDHSTVTDLARLRGWSTSVPITTAVW